MPGFSTDKILENLSNNNENIRFNTTNLLLDTLSNLQNNDEKTYSSILRKLFEGLSSNKNCSRIGFSTALTQVLRQFKPSLKQVFKLVEEIHSPGEDHNNKTDFGNISLGKVLSYASIFQAFTFSDTSKNLKKVKKYIHSMIDNLFSIAKQFPALSLICTQTLKMIISKTSQNLFEEFLLPALKKELDTEPEHVSADLFYLIILLSDTHKSSVKSLIKSKWQSTSPVNPDNYKHIVQIISSSSSYHPIVHPVCESVLSIVMENSKNRQDFNQFWSALVDTYLITGKYHKNFLALQLLKIALLKIQSTHHIEVILSKEVLTLLSTTLSGKNMLLSGPCKQILSELVSFVEENGSCPDLQLFVVTRLLNHSFDFDNRTHSQTISFMIKHLNDEVRDSFIAMLLSAFDGRKTAFAFPESMSTRSKCAIHYLIDVSMNEQFTSSSHRLISILKFFLLRAYFVVKSPCMNIEHCNHPSENLDESSRAACHSAIYSILNKLAGRLKGDLQLYCSIYHELLFYAKMVLKSCKQNNKIEQYKPFNDMYKEKWRSLLKSLESKRNNSGANSNKKQAFELLELHLGLQFLSDPSNASDILEDFRVCCAKASEKQKSNESEIQWVEVFTELLLTILSNESKLSRVIVESVFSNIVPHITETSLQIVIDVLLPSSKDEESRIGFDDLDESNSSDEESGSDSGSESEDSGVQASVSSENFSDDNSGEQIARANTPVEDADSSLSDDEEDVADSEINERQRQALKFALRDAALPDDNESDNDDVSDLDDTEMFKLDEGLAAIFRQMKQEKSEQKMKSNKLKEFKLRCVGLLLIYVKQNPAIDKIIFLIEPLIQFIDNSYKSLQLKDQVEKSNKVLKSIVSNKTVLKGCDVSEDLIVEKIQTLVHLSGKVTEPLVDQLAQLILFLLSALEQSLSGDQSKKEKSLNQICDIIAESLKSFCTKRAERPNYFIFPRLLAKYSISFWNISNEILSQLTSDNVVPFCKTKMCNLLLVLVTSNTVTRLEKKKWAQFSQKLYDSLIKIIVSKDKEKLSRLKYIEGVLLVLHRLLTIKLNSGIKEPLGQEALTQIDGFVVSSKNVNLKNVCKKILRLPQHWDFRKKLLDERSESGKRKSEMLSTGREKRQKTDNCKKNEQNEISSPQKLSSNHVKNSSTTKNNASPKNSKIQSKSKATLKTEQLHSDDKSDSDSSARSNSDLSTSSDSDDADMSE